MQARPTAFLLAGLLWGLALVAGMPELSVAIVVVIVVVLFLMGFMAAADYVLGNVFTRIITGGGA